MLDSSLPKCDSGSNMLSGSFSTSFGAQSQLIFVAINGNSALVRHSPQRVLCIMGCDTGLGPLGIRSMLCHYVSVDAGTFDVRGLAKPSCCVQDCSIRATLPSILSKATQLKSLLLVVATTRPISRVIPIFPGQQPNIWNSAFEFITGPPCTANPYPPA
jgi:hypothetical protein